MSARNKRTVIGIIPARYGSQRLPGKILLNINGKSLIQRTYENAQRCKNLSELIVATDDQRIFDHVSGFGGNVVMTSADCATGSDRIAEVFRKLPYRDEVNYVVNIQGDEPCICPSTIDAVINSCLESTEAEVGTAVVEIHKHEEATDPSIVKCVFNLKHWAIYFSRALIPHDREGLFLQKHKYYRHIGLYCYRSDFLETYATLPATPLQLAENLEQLKVIEHGYRMKVAIVNDLSIGVDTHADLKRVEEFLWNQNTSSSQEESLPH